MSSWIVGRPVGDPITCSSWWRYMNQVVILIVVITNLTPIWSNLANSPSNLVVYHAHCVTLCICTAADQSAWVVVDFVNSDRSVALLLYVTQPASRIIF